MWFNYLNLCRILAITASLLIHLSLLSTLDLARFSAPAAISEMSSGVIYFDAIPPSATADLSCVQSKSCFQMTGKLVEGNKLLPHSQNGVSTEAGFKIVAEKNTQPIYLSIEEEEPLIALGIAYYYSREDLTQIPKALTNPNIQVPINDDIHIIGSVKIRVFLSENGWIDNVTVSNVTLPEEYVSEIVSAYKKIEFSPGELNGEKVKSQIEFEVSFLAEQKPSKISKRAGKF